MSALAEIIGILGRLVIVLLEIFMALIAFGILAVIVAAIMRH
jgi:hypothetical protein